MTAVGVHGVDVDVAVARGSENDVLAIAADGGFRIVAGSVGQQAQIAVIELRGVDLVAVVNGPHVTLRIVRLRWTLRTGGVSRGIQDAIARRENVTARGTALALSLIH